MRVYFLEEKFLPKLNNSWQLHFSVKIFDIKGENYRMTILKKMLKK